MDDVCALECDPADERSLPLVGSRQRERPQDGPSEHTTTNLPYRLAPVATSLLDPSPSHGRGSPDTKLFQESCSGFIPPVRPSSTPYPFADTKETSCSSTLEFAHGVSANHASVAPTEDAICPRPPQIPFSTAPIEIYESILDHLLGSRTPVSLTPVLRSPSAVGGRGTARRSSRRRQMTDLALVNREWRILVQQRLYRHVKLKGTLSSIDEAIVHFADSERLASYVRHIEIWFPVFQPRTGPLTLSFTSIVPLLRSDGLSTTTYILPGNNCTLEDVFRFVSLVLPHARVLTLEGGERRKAPKVVHFHKHRCGFNRRPTLPVVHSITTLVTKGQWNLMRDHQDFVAILGALPNIEEWQGAYNKPKSKSYITMSHFMSYIPASIKNLSLCLETDYRREAVVPAFYAKAVQQIHICTALGKIMPRLDRFSYTGRICHHFFDIANQSAMAPSSRLRSIDVTLKNCCRQSNIFHDSGSGIQDRAFMEAFEKLVISGIKSLAQFQQVEYLRIRFIDLDSLLPALNPYFLFKRGECSGVWSGKIIKQMAQARPTAKFMELSDSFGDLTYLKDGRIVITPESPRNRITSLNLANYQIFFNPAVAV